MKKNTSSYVWGGLLILLGILFAGKALNLFSFTIFFRGWWTLFIIVPCFIGLFSDGGEKTPYLIGLCVGVFLLLARQNILDWGMFWPLCLAVVLVLTGIKMLVPKSHKNYDDGNYKTYQGDGTQNQGTDAGYQSNQNNTAYQNSQTYQNDSANGNNTQNSSNGGYSYTYSSNQYGSNQNQGSDNSGYQNTYQNARQGNGQCACTAVLSGRELRFDNEVFQGAILSAVLGGIEIDLRNAIIRENVVIEAKAFLGGIDIYVPSYVRVVVNATPILGGVDNKTITPMGANEQTITIYLNATCVLGGVDVK